MVIKDEYSAHLINSRLERLQIKVDHNDPKSWKYYRNLSGLYHMTDVPMEVISLDTHEIIPFTKESLRVHRATKRAYTYGNKYFEELVEKHKSQETLIRGILYPIDIEVALAAPNYTILSYDKSLVEANESYLMVEMQGFINNYFSRWFNFDYGRVDEAYPLAMMAILFSKLPLEILVARKRRVHTGDVHSYHVRQYLTSFSRVGHEFDFMTQRQRFWLYRNIRYLNRNIGRGEIFDQVVEKVMTDRGFSVVRHDLTLGYEDFIANEKPEVYMHRQQVNNIPPAHGGERASLDRVLDSEMPLARDNPDFRQMAEERAVSGMSSSLLGRTKTKVLESSVLDRQDAEPFTLSSVLLNHWVWLAQLNYYKSIITFYNPSNGDSYRLNALDAFIFYTYAINRHYGITLEFVPTVYLNRVKRDIPPTREEIKSIVDTDYVSEDFLDYIFDTQVPLERCESVYAFRELCIRIHRQFNAHRDARHYQNDYRVEGYLNTAMDRFSMGKIIKLANNMPYDEWFAEKGIDIADMGVNDYATMSKEIYETVTGFEASTATEMRAVHAAMIRILNELTSYSVQMIKQINDSAIKIVDGKMPKLTVPKVHTRLKPVVRLEPVIPLSIKHYSKTIKHGKVEAPIAKSVKKHRHVKCYIPVNVVVNQTKKDTRKLYLNTKFPQVTIVPPEVIRFPDDREVMYDQIDYLPEANPLLLNKTGPMSNGKPLLTYYSTVSQAMLDNLLGV